MPNPAKPATIGDPGNLPAALRPKTQQKRWVCWRWTWHEDKGRWDKPPLQACNPDLPAKSNDPTTWGGYTDAIAAVAAGKADGIGYMLADDELDAVDLDHCHDPETGTIDAWAQKEIDTANGAYVEVTVSGQGLRILGVGAGGELGRKWKIPNTTNGAAIEVYRRTNRYITISGAQISGGAELTDIDGVLDDIARRFDTEKSQKPKPAIGLIEHGADIDALIATGAPPGIRSEMFAKVVWALATAGYSLDEIQGKLAAHPDGIASKYSGRLEKEVERCFRKWSTKNPKQATSGAPGWPDLTEEGEPKRTYRNARAAVMALGVVCSYDEFHDRMLVGGHPIQQWAGELTDAVNVVLRQATIDRFEFDPGKDNIADAATELCLEHRFDPVLDYLDGLDWDETPRLDKWVITYLGAADTPLNRAMGKLALVAGVHRVRNPGCKFDHILTLEGGEGTMKSTSIVTLAGVENFSDQTILTQSDKEQQELVRGVWIYEIADLAGMKRADVEKIKAFASRTHDRARPAYGRRRVDAPRRCVFFATTNEDDYLQSQTGNRRFWPLNTGITGPIDIEGLRRDRDQLWAEAAEVEAKGEPLVLPKDLWGEASAAQDERRQQDPWDDILAGVKGRPYPTEQGGAEEWIKAQELLFTLSVTADRASPETYKRLKRVMARNGWRSGKHRFGGEKQQRGYWRPTTQSREGEISKV
jgi:hypothetical protein